MSITRGVIPFTDTAAHPHNLATLVLDDGSELPVHSISPFAPIRGATVALAAGPAATTAPVALPACTATTYRARNAAASASPVTWTLSTSNTTVPALPVPYSSAGTGGTAGDKTLDPDTVGIFGLTPAQQTALAAGTLYLSAITPSGGSATLTITPGNGS